MPEFPKSSEYQYAEDIISRLKTSSELAGSVLDEPFDASEQVSKLTMATQQYDLAIAVMPREPEFIGESADGAKAGIVTHTAAILILTTTNISSTPAGRRIADATAAVMRHLYRWTLEDDDICWLDPWFSACSPLDTTELEGLENTAGRVLLLSVRKSL